MSITFKHVAAGIALAFGGLASANAATITISCGNNAADVEFCGKFAEEWGKKNGHTVKMYTPPASTTDNLALLRQQFAAKSSDLDVIMIDVVWPGVIKDHLVDLKKYSKGVEKDHFPAIVANNTVDGKLLGMPWFTDAGLLFYRKDLLAKHGVKVPQTWDDLAAGAKKIQDAERATDKDFQGFVFQAKAYEGLTCDALEWVYSYGGGTIVDGKGNITINNPQAAKALDAAASWIGTIAPQGVLNYGEEDSRGVWQNGKAAFMRNWPYAWSLGQAADSPIKDKIGVAALPAGTGPGAKKAATPGWLAARCQQVLEECGRRRFAGAVHDQRRHPEEACRGWFVQPDDPGPVQGRRHRQGEPVHGRTAGRLHQRCGPPGHRDRPEVPGSVERLLGRHARRAVEEVHRRGVGQEARSQAQADQEGQVVICRWCC